MQEEKNIPTHIAIIMDGNRRWAKNKKIDTRLGHKKGAETLENIVKYCNKIGIKYLTVYAFSTENWKRSKEEVGALMLLLQNYLDDFIKKAGNKNIKINMIGERKNLSNRILKSIDKAMEITEELVSKYLYTNDIPDPDLLIRTSGELRTSNFLPWQLVYSEFYFTDKLWPDFEPYDLDKAIEEYNRRTRKFGAN